MTNSAEVPIELGYDEALVLFALLHRWEDEGQLSAPQHKAEQVALWNLSAALERVLVTPFNTDYQELVSEARARLTAAE